jgi:hypothetical protein
LYQYRSDITHGNLPGFDGKLQEIKDTKILYEYLYDLVKKMILFFIENPELVNDLKTL